MVKRAMVGLAAAATMIAAATSIAAAPAAGQGRAENGAIAFVRSDPASDTGAIFTVAGKRHRVAPLFTRASAQSPHWSPSGRVVAIFCCDDGMAAHLIDPATRRFREFAAADPALEMHCGFSWSPDARRLSCETFGVTDPRRNGIYSVRASDGRGLERITSIPGGDDIPGDFSPDGRRMVFVRSDSSGPLGLFVATVRGGRPRRLTPAGMVVDPNFGGRWSPRRDRILFVASRAQDRRRAIWIVLADGRHLRQVPIRPACGGLRSDPRSTGCFDPDWSPDGTRIVFTRAHADGTHDLFTVRPDGRRLARVTTSGDAGEADWGPRVARR
jgi:WD40 repeat protein